MDSLSDRLKKLGVQVGSSELNTNKRTYPIDHVVPGEILQTPLGESYVVHTHYSEGTGHGNYQLRWAERLRAISLWLGYHELASTPPEAFAFLDTETTGLAGGSGTFVFLIGVARFEGGEFHVAQYFLRDPGEEPALLAALEGFLNPIEVLITFNGKAFDLPFLQTRYIANGWVSPWEPVAHIDLLHLARRLWKERLPSRTLGELEKQILGVERSGEEVPGWLVPLIYVDYLASQDARPLKGVFYHNLMDVVSLSVLLDLCAGMLDQGEAGEEIDPIDLIAMAKLWEDLGEVDRAIGLYKSGMSQDLPQEILLNAIRRLSFIHKRASDYKAALPLWRLAAEAGEIYACVEIAKYEEHTARNFTEALVWTHTAVQMLDDLEIPEYKRDQWGGELDWRARRLERKLRRK